MRVVGPMAASSSLLPAAAFSSGCAQPCEWRAGRAAHLLSSGCAPVCRSRLRLLVGRDIPNNLVVPIRDRNERDRLQVSQQRFMLAVFLGKKNRCALFPGIPAQPASKNEGVARQQAGAPQDLQLIEPDLSSFSQGRQMGARYKSGIDLVVQYQPDGLVMAAGVD